MKLNIWEDNEPWKRGCVNFFGENNSNYPKSDRINLIKRTTWILSRIVHDTTITGAHTFYTDANKSGKVSYKSKDLSKVEHSFHNSVQKLKLYAILTVQMDIKEPLNIASHLHYTEKVVLHIEITEFIPDYTELTSLFIHVQDIIRNRFCPIYIIHTILYGSARFSSTR